VAFFKVGQTSSSWRRDWNGKKLRLKNLSNGQTLDVQVVDTCGDHDCGGCCTRNAKQRGGDTLIDLEYHTAKRFYGGRPTNSKIQYQIL
jgi:hypothetical protein